MQDNYYYKHLSHNLLRTFYMVAQEQSITHAAKRLFVSQPTTTLQIQALERELGHQLFDRHGPKIALTTQGHKLYELVQPIMVRLESLKSAFEDSLDDINHGELNIASGQTTSLYILPKYIQKFKVQYPEVKVRLHNVAGHEVLHLIKNDKMDIAIGNIDLSDVPAGIDYAPFVAYYSSLITAKNHPLANQSSVSAKDIAKYKLILPPRRLKIWRTIDAMFNRHKLKYFVGIETGGWEIVKKYVQLDLGISIINDASITNHESLNIISIKGMIPAKDYGIISRQTKLFSPQCQAFMALFKQECLNFKNHTKA